MQSFIKDNIALWQHVKPQSKTKLLIEPPTNPMKTHLNGLLSILINQARGAQPYWLVGHHAVNDSLYKSYVSNAEQILLPQNTFLNKTKLFLRAVSVFTATFMNRNILGITYDGVKYGDYIYDTYLKKYHKATIRRPDTRLFRVIYNCISQHEKIKKVIQEHSFEYFLSSNILLTRAALRAGCSVFIRDGHEELTLQLIKKLDEVYNYAFKPKSDEIVEIEKLHEKKFDDLYKTVCERHTGDTAEYFSAQDAYASDKKIFTDRDEFCGHFGLAPEKKNIFIMLHAFNDYPHSLFKWMLFKDYYDWFTQTFTFALSHPEVNWIFKQHPSIRLYRTDDVNFKKIFSDSPPHITYIDEHNQINTKSLIACADLVVTCIGSAGFELPAMAGIPALIAGDTFYNGLGFTMEPKTVAEYFKDLEDASRVKKLSPIQRKKAQAAFIYIYNITKVPFSACPPISVIQQKDPHMSDWYWDAVRSAYRSKANTITSEMSRYIRAVSDPDFYKLLNTNE